MSNDYSSFVSFAERLADASQDVIVQYFGKQPKIDAKADSTPVTIADQQVEQVMRDMLAKEYPEHGIYGEEYGQTKSDAEYVWVLDPIDGTSAFVTGRPIFGTLIALSHRGIPVLGVINQPITKERWIGLLGDQNKTFRARSCKSIADAVFCTTSPYLFAEDENIRFQELRSRCRYTVFGGDCYNYAQLASGHVDLVVESGLKPYDFMALVPVIESAGGVITDWSGKPLTISSKGRVLAAGDPRVHDEVLEVLKNAH